jgi:hypothetical protein
MMSHHSQTAPNILEYSDFHAFLEAHYAFMKATKTGWSLRNWARQIGLKSPASLGMIKNGSRKPSVSTIERMSKNFGFNGEQARHFRFLAASAASRMHSASEAGKVPTAVVAKRCVLSSRSDLPDLGRAFLEGVWVELDKAIAVQPEGVEIAISLIVEVRKKD